MATRLSVNVNDDTAAALRELADSRDTTVTEIVRRAVSVYKFIEDEIGPGSDKTLQLVDADRSVTTIQLV